MHYTPENEPGNSSVSKEKLSKAAKAYLDRAQKYNEMINEAKAEYNIGMRHLANMMGQDPETFTQADANVREKLNNHYSIPITPHNFILSILGSH